MNALICSIRRHVASYGWFDFYVRLASGVVLVPALLYLLHGALLSS